MAEDIIPHIHVHIYSVIFIVYSIDIDRYFTDGKILEFTGQISISLRPYA
jgi:hypothetical protein